MQKSENLALNLLRTLAALSVVVGHVRALLFLDWADVPHNVFSALFYFLTSLGEDAVIVFFVLSGFWVGGSVLRSSRGATFSWRQYLLRRGVRLLIVLVPACALAFAVGWAILLHFPTSGIANADQDFHVVPADFRGTLTFPTLLGNMVFLQGIFVPVLGTNGPLWSLAYEFWYYILFPLTWLAVRPGITLLKRLIFGVLAVGIAFLVGPAILALLLVWCLGVVVAYCADPARAWLASMRWRAPLFQILGVVLVAGALLIRHSGFREAVVGDYILGLATAVLVASLLTDVPLSHWALAPLRFLSVYAHSSYSLYTIHLPILLLVTAAFIPSPAARSELGMGSIAVLITAILLMMGLAWLFALATERRTDVVRRWLDQKLPNSYF